MRTVWPIKILIIAFAAYLGLLGIDLVLQPDVIFSEQENRYLEQRPVFSWPGLVSGQYGRQLELWMTDQIAGRDRWVGYKVELTRLIGFRDNRGIYFSHDGYLIQRFSHPGSDLLQENTAGILHLQRLLPDIPVTFILAPTSAAVYPGKLPRLAVTDDQAAFIQEVRDLLGDSIVFIDVLPALLDRSDEAIYFRTDHHWTMRGAFYAWQAWQEQTGRTRPVLADYEIKKVSDAFYGTSWSRAGLYRLQPDFIEVFQLRTARPLTMTTGARVRESLFNEGFLDRKDKYSYFLDGNQPLTVIRLTEDQPPVEARRIMVIKNSFANCLIPFLTRDYTEIHVIDLRHNQTNLAQYARDQQIDEVLYLYDTIGFSNDRLLRLLSRIESANP